MRNMGPYNVAAPTPSDSADAILADYSFGVMPLAAWATEDLVSLANAIDDEIERRSEIDGDSDASE